MRFAHWLKRGVVALAASALVLTGSPGPAKACTQLWIPDAYTADANTWYAGRVEDWACRYLKIFGVEPAHENGWTYTSYENWDSNGFTWTSKGPTYRYTYARDHSGQWLDEDNGGVPQFEAYSAAGINEKGVSCSATLSMYPRDTVSDVDPFNEDSGIGEYNYASIILGESPTAREGVQLIGSLVEEHGAYSSDQILINDSTESWLLCVCSGHQWFAVQLPEDMASINPNMGLYFDVDLSDPNVLHSKNIVDEATLTDADGTCILQHKEDGTPDVMLTYFDPDSLGSASRFLIGRQYFGALDGVDYTLDETTHKVTSLRNALMFFVPGRSDYTTFDAIRALAARGSGDLDANEYSALTGVGRDDSAETHIFEIHRGQDPRVATVQWTALSRDEFSVAIPTYSALLTDVNWRYGKLDMDPTHIGENFYDRDNADVKTAMQAGEWDNYLPFVMIDLNDLAYNNRANVATGLRAYLDAVQQALVEEHAQVGAHLTSLPEDQWEKFATDAANAAAECTWVKCEGVLQEVREYLAGDQSEPFVASDYDAETGGLVSELGYAASVIPEEKPDPEPPVEPGTASSAIAVAGTYGDVVTGATASLDDVSALLTDEERARLEEGHDFSLILTVNELDEATVASGEVSALTKLAKNPTGIDYLDLALTLRETDADGNECNSRAISELTDPLTITLALHEGLKAPSNTTRAFSVLSVHDLEAQDHEATYKSAEHTVTFSASRFSTYAVAHKDTTKKDTAQKAPATTSTNRKSSSRTPETGDPLTNNTTIIAIVGAGALALAVGCGLRFASKKE